ncbi:MAG: hypothetical protein ACM3XM_05420 [Mycobacterium leprae]
MNEYWAFLSSNLGLAVSLMVPTVLIVLVVLLFSWPRIVEWWDRIRERSHRNEG